MLRIRLFASCNTFYCKMPKFYYGVRRGRVPGVYTNWSECESQVKGFIHPAFKKFSTYEEAQAFISRNSTLSCTTFSTDLSASPSFEKTATCTTREETSFTGSAPDRSHSTNDGPVNLSYLCSVVEEMKNNMQRLVGDVEIIRTGLAEVKSSVRRLEENIFIAPGTKRRYCTDSNGKDEDSAAKQEKYSKFDQGIQHFTGSRFEDKDGVHVYTDGGCFSNGKCGARAGIGVFWASNDPLNVSERLLGRPTNNRAEIHAAIRAVQQAKQRNIENLILHTDSQFLINSITKWIKGWKKNQWIKTTGSPVINRQDFEELDKELRGINVKWVYVRGHAGNAANESADLLAKQGAEKAVPK